MAQRRFDTLGFAPLYACQVDPELPGTGQWDCPHYGFHRDGGATEPFRSRWGTPVIVRVTLPGTGQWVGSFEAGGMHALTGVFACPRPSDALVVCDGQPYLVDVTAPTRTTALHLRPVTQVCRVGDLDQIVLVSYSNLAALGPAGLAWHSERLCLTTCACATPPRAASTAPATSPAAPRSSPWTRTTAGSAPAHGSWTPGPAASITQHGASSANSPPPGGHTSFSNPELAGFPM